MAEVQEGSNTDPGAACSARPTPRHNAYRSAMADVGIHLKLPGGLEDEFWGSSASVQHLVAIDSFGLSHGAISHYFVFMGCRKLLPRMLVGLAGVLQVIQLLWLWVARDSYMRRRQWVQLAQRTRYLLMIFFVGIYIPGLERIVVQNAAVVPKGLKAFFSATMIIPLSNNSCSLNHHLPFRFEVPLIMAVPLMELYGRFQQQQRVLKLAKFDEAIQEACTIAQQLLLMPLMLEDPQGSDFSGSKPCKFIIVLCTLLVGAMLPLCIAYSIERSAKQKFLTRRRAVRAAAVAAGRADGAVPDAQVPEPIRLSELWALAAMACCIASMWTDWL